MFSPGESVGICMSEDAGRGRRRKKVRRFIAPRRERFLEVLRRTGNVRIAAKAVGICPTSVEQRRRRDAEFAIACEAALDEASRRLAGAKDAFDGVDDARFETIRRGRGGRWQIVATRSGKWSKAKEDEFLEVLRATGNVAAAARAVGVSERLIWQRRAAWPGFRQRIEEALEEAELALEFRIACHGNNVGAVGDGGALHRRSPSPSPSRQGRGEEKFDPEFALRFLKWREEKRRGGGRRGRVPPPPAIEEVTERIVRKVKAIKRHRGGREA